MTSPHERLNQAIDARRLDLGMRWNDVASSAKIALVTLRAVRRGENTPSALTKRQIEDALLWAHGSIDAILDGGDPTPADAQPAPPQGDDLDGELEKAGELLARATEILEELRGRRREAG